VDHFGGRFGVAGQVGVKGVVLFGRDLVFWPQPEGFLAVDDPLLDLEGFFLFSLFFVGIFIVAFVFLLFGVEDDGDLDEI
jgi:hypothetical protein